MHSLFCFPVCSSSPQLLAGWGARHLVCSALSMSRLHPSQSSAILSHSGLFISALSRYLLKLSLHLNFGLPLLLPLLFSLFSLSISPHPFSVHVLTVCSPLPSTSSVSLFQSLLFVNLSSPILCTCPHSLLPTTFNLKCFFIPISSLCQSLLTHSLYMSSQSAPHYLQPQVFLYSNLFSLSISPHPFSVHVLTVCSPLPSTSSVSFFQSLLFVNLSSPILCTCPHSLLPTTFNLKCFFIPISSLCQSLLTHSLYMSSQSAPHYLQPQVFLFSNLFSLSISPHPFSVHVLTVCSPLPSTSSVSLFQSLLFVNLSSPILCTCPHSLLPTTFNLKCFFFPISSLCQSLLTHSLYMSSQSAPHYLQPQVFLYSNLFSLSIYPHPFSVHVLTVCSPLPSPSSVSLFQYLLFVNLSSPILCTCPHSLLPTTFNLKCFFIPISSLCQSLLTHSLYMSSQSAPHYLQPQVFLFSNLFSLSISPHPFSVHVLTVCSPLPSTSSVSLFQSLLLILHLHSVFLFYFTYSPNTVVFCCL